jgi:hypothetical protein
LRNQGRARPLIEGAAGFAGVPVKSGYGTRNQRVIIGHLSVMML